MKNILIYLLAIVVLTGCVSTPYQPTGLTGGFRELQLKKDVWRVSFNGNGFTTHESAQTYWLYRCATLTLEKGYDGFELLSDVQLVLPLTPEQFFGSNSEYIQTRSSSSSTPIYIPMEVDHSRFPSIQSDILMLKKPFEAAPPKVFDAQYIKDALDSYVNGEKCSAGETSGNVCPHLHDYLFPKGKFDKPEI